MRCMGLLSVITPSHPLESKISTVLAGDLNLIKVPSDMSDNQVLFLSDILATGWHATELGNVHDGDSVAIWGCGPGQCLLLTSYFSCSPILQCARCHKATPGLQSSIGMGMGIDIAFSMWDSARAILLKCVASISSSSTW